MIAFAGSYCSLFPLIVNGSSSREQFALIFNKCYIAAFTSNGGCNASCIELKPLKRMSGSVEHSSNHAKIQKKLNARTIYGVESMVTNHISDQELQRYYNRKLTMPKQLARLERHLRWCAACLHRMEEIDNHVKGGPFLYRFMLRSLSGVVAIWGRIRLRLKVPRRVK